MNFKKIKINHVTPDKDFIVVGADPNVAFLIGARETNVINFRKNLSGFSNKARGFYISVRYINKKDDPEYYL